MTGAFWFLLFSPHLRDLSALQESAGTIQDRVATGTQTIASLSGLDDDMKEAERATQEFHNRITATADVGPFVEQVSRIAARLGLRDPKIVPLTPLRLETITILPIQISFESSYTDSFDFVRAVEQMARTVRVTEFVVKRRRFDDQPIVTAEGFSTTTLTVHLYCETIGAGSTT